MDKLKALQTLIAIVDRGSLTAAADALGSSLPAVVRTLAGLEAQLGVRLVNRTTRRLALTDDGRHYLERARRIVADLDEADRSLGREQADPGGRLSVTAPVLFGQHHVAPAVAGFLQRYPQTHVNLVLLDRVVNLVEEGLDLGVRIGPLQDSTLVAQAVGSVRRVIVASPALLRRLGTPQHPQELATLPCVHGSGPDGNRWSFREGGAGRPFAVPVQGRFECNLVAPLLDACAAGLGFVRCFSYQCAPYIAAKRLKIVLAGHEPEPWPISLTYPSSRLLPARARVFIDWMKQELATIA